MLLGYNHNVKYKGEVFHIQTEDSGVKNPHVITLLFREGVILCSKKISYADILSIESLEAVVEDLMKEQHKDMLRRLKSGEFDERAFSVATQQAVVTELKEEVVKESYEPAPQPASGVELLFQTAATEKQTQEKPASNEQKDDAPVSLDDAILNFFGASR